MTPLYEVSIEKDYQKIVAEGQVRRLAESAITRGDILKFGSAEEYVVPAGANEAPCGLALNTVTAADLAAYAADENEIHRVEVSVATIGYGVLLAGLEVTVGDWIVSDANARGVPATGDGADEIVGKAYKSASGNGEEFHILIHFIPATSERG